jgi:transposase
MDRMIIVGIDIAKCNHQAVIIDEHGAALCKPFAFANSNAGVKKLTDAIAQVAADSAEVIVGMEATGHYWLALYSALLPLGFTLHVINPIQTDAMRHATTIRKSKTDVIDCELVAQTIRFGRFSVTRVADEDMIALRQLTRFHFSLVGSVSEVKLQIIALLDQVFPEYQSLFSDTFGKTSVELLLSHTTPEDILALDTGALAEILTRCSRGRLGAEKAEQVKSAAAHSFGVKFGKDAFTFQIRSLLEQIRLVESQIDRLDAQVAEIYASFNAQLHTVPGVGPVLAAAILAEVGDISRFGSEPAKLVAYAGIDPSVKQSGGFTGSQNRMSKRGSPYLRRALWLAASVAYRHDHTLAAFYQKKRAEGKVHMTAIGAVARKLTYVVFAILRDNKPYLPPSAPQLSP